MSAIVAYGAVSALGEGPLAFAVPGVGERPVVAVARDPELEGAGLLRPVAARARVGEGERAHALLWRAAQGCGAMLDRVLPGWQGLRIGLALGTSSGGLRVAEGVFDQLRAGELDPPSGRTREFTYFAALPRLAELLGIEPSRVSLVLGACASSTLAIGLGHLWLAEGSCDLVLAGGFDAVGVFVAAGFEALRATSKEGEMRPFSQGRDGLVLGDGAALVAMVAPGPGGPPALGHVRGFGATADGVHLTAPDRTGGGLARAAAQALREASLEVPVALVSAHGTATDFNDAAEARAIELALGDSARLAILHAFKAQIGHTLGAAGVLESLASLDAMARGILPGSAGSGEVMPELIARRLPRSEPGEVPATLKLSAAFGGANACLVLARSPGPPERRSPGRAYLTRAVHVGVEPTLDELAALCRRPKDKLGRADKLSRLALLASARLEGACGSLAGAGIVLGHGLATQETNALFWEGIRTRGARMAEPRRFPYTSPNAACGECAIAFGLTGPGFAVGTGAAGGLEALSTAASLVRSGHADRIVVVVVDDVGAASRPYVDGVSGAVALLVTAAPAWAEIRAAEVSLSLPADLAPRIPCAHSAVLPLAGGGILPPEVLECGPFWGVFARVTLLAV